MIVCMTDARVIESEPPNKREKHLIFKKIINALILYSEWVCDWEFPGNGDRTADRMKKDEQTNEGRQDDEKETI